MPRAIGKILVIFSRQSLVVPDLEMHMDPTDIGLFHLTEQRLAWVDRRQRLLAQNIANADTPGFKARDLAPFEVALTGSALSQTSIRHLPSHSQGLSANRNVNAARSPNGNAVSVEDQLGRVADTAGIQELVLNIHHRYQAMFRTALGRGG
jgi:flagellar basal-body rod protein FlgB